MVYTCTKTSSIPVLNVREEKEPSKYDRPLLRLTVADEAVEVPVGHALGSELSLSV